MNNIFKNTTLGLQHVLAMYAGAVIVPLIVGGALGLSSEELTLSSLVHARHLKN